MDLDESFMSNQDFEEAVSKLYDAYYILVVKVTIVLLFTRKLASRSSIFLH